MKLHRILIMVTLSMFISIGSFASKDAIKVKVDGVELNTDVPAQAFNGRTLVPIRAIFESLGANVKYYSDGRYAIADKGEVSVVFYVGSNKVYKNEDVPIELDAAPRIINNRMFVPARFASEVFGADVKWDQATKTVIITSPMTDNQIWDRARESLGSNKVNKFNNIIYDQNGSRYHHFTTTTFPKIQVIVNDYGHLFDAYEYNSSNILRPL